jgi:hypothetical protein
MVGLVEQSDLGRFERVVDCIVAKARSRDVRL